MCRINRPSISMGRTLKGLSYNNTKYYTNLYDIIHIINIIKIDIIRTY